MRTIWTIAIEAFSWMELDDLSLAAALTKTVTQLQIHDERRITAAGDLVHECLRRQNFIDKLIDLTLAPASLSDFDLGVQAFLRLYTYTIQFIEKDRTHAIKLAKLGRRILGWRTVMPVEEVLGKILALNPQRILDDANEVERISLQTFNPMWFTHYCLRLLGRSAALKLLRTHGDASSPLLSINPLKATEDSVLSNLSPHGITIEPVEALPHTYRVVEEKTDLTSLKAYWDGLFFLQNLATCVTVSAGTPTADATVLDVGAAHDYEATYAATLMGGHGRILAVDYPTPRLDVLRKQLDTLGVTTVEVVAADLGAGVPFEGEADVIYLTPPSTGSGAFWRTASKWRGEEAVKRMVDLQWRLLTHCVPHLAPDGFLVYATSSILLEENELLIERFLAHYPEFRLAHITPRLGKPGFRGQMEVQRLYPHIHHVDGTYIAKLVRL
jgi:16S rRNA C967 or C1407 C5-methylase (RsmB/RsmF family)